MGILVGISACVLGDKVRFDGGHKRNHFVTEDLTEYFNFQPVCPEVGIGLPVPRPTIRLLKKLDQIHLVDTKDANIDYTKAMLSFSEQQAERLKLLRGYIVCAKSPTCGLERVKLYMDNGNTIPGGAVGLYTKTLLEKMPWLPIEEDGRLNDPVLRENFVSRVFALEDLYQSTETLTRDSLIKFHSRYKLVLMAHSQPQYRELGRMVANIKEWDLNEFFKAYRLAFMMALTNHANHKNNTNVLMHIQGYFKRRLTTRQRQELSDIILKYRHGELPILAVLTLINHYLEEYPDPYLSSQVFLSPHPDKLKLRLGL